MKSFLTGSRVYGTPKPESDVDLCVLLTYQEVRKLALLAWDNTGSASEIPKSVSLRFGKLNLICTYDEACFAEWKIATDDLTEASPVTKDDAIEHFKKIEALRKVSKADGSGSSQGKNLDFDAILAELDREASERIAAAEEDERLV